MSFSGVARSAFPDGIPREMSGKISRVVSLAHANIALVKYWGKRSASLNIPATPSISLALDGLTTETVVEKRDGDSDTVTLNGKPAAAPFRERVRRYLDLWRAEKLIRGSFHIETVNHFPTGAGLASSASGFAALAVSLNAFSERKLTRLQVSRLARRGSGSAARSVPGGLAAMGLGEDPSARLLASPEQLDWGMVIALVDGGDKEIGSTDGMKLSRLASPYFKAWTAIARRDYREMLGAIENRHFTRIGELSEANALAMHACMIATRPALVYWNEITISLVKAVVRWRREGVEAYITIDAGPHVALVCKLRDFNLIRQKAIRIPGVLELIPCHPAGGARVVSWS